MGAFFGRTHELAALHDAAVASVGGETAAVMVLEGDAGSGKTRTLQELLAGISDCTKLIVSCYEPERRLPFALGRTLTAALSETSASAREHLVDAAFSSTATAPGWERRYEAVHRAVQGSAPIVFAVDDVQWCDEESAALLHYIVRGAIYADSAVLLVLAGRPSPPVATLTSSLQRLVAEQFLELRLGPLDPAAAVALVQSLDPELEGEQARQLADRAGGSPFWCEVLATAVGHPDRIHELVARRLQGRSRDAAAALEIIVAIGRPAEATAIAEILRWPEARATTAIDELSNAGLVTSAARVRIAHDLLRAELGAQVAVSSRAHTLIAKWLEDTSGDDVNLLLAAAEHLSRAGVSSGRVLQRAFASPRRRLIGPQGLPALAAAVDGLSPDDPAAVPLNGEVAALAAELGDHALAAERWIRIAARLPDNTARSRAWLAASEAAQHLEQVQEARHYLDLARKTAPDDPVLGIELDAAEAHVLRWLENDGTASARVTASALQRARALGDAESDLRDPALSRAYIKALEMACIDAMQRDDADEILRLAEELADISAGADARASVRARLRGGSALLLVGRLGAAAEVLGGAWSDARQAFLNDLVLDVGSWLTWNHHLLGRLVDAEEVASECTAVAARTGAMTRPAVMAVQWQAILAISRGEPHTALEELRNIAAGEADDHHRIWLRRWVATWLARLDGERAAVSIEAQLRAGAEDVEAAGCVRCGTEFVLAGAESLARIGMSDEAEQWLTSDAARARNDLENWGVTRATASLAVAYRTDVIQALQHAIAFAKRMGMRLELVWALLDLGRAVAPDDPEAAIVHLRRATEEAETAGAVTEMRLAAQLLRDLGVHAWAPAAGDAEAFEGLSPREREIATLVSEGASNPDIARRLYLSRKTIERHVSNIFTKLDVRNRAQLAARVSALKSHEEV